ncbi:hypothetical protein GCM10018966_040860 [Streptomyces yanii]
MSRTWARLDDDGRVMIMSSKLDSVGDLGVSLCGGMVNKHARVVPMTDAAAEVPVVPSPPFR